MASILGIILAPSVVSGLYKWITSRVRVTIIRDHLVSDFAEYNASVEIRSKREIFEEKCLHFYTTDVRSKITSVKEVKRGSAIRFDIKPDEVGGFDVIFSRFLKGRRIRLEVNSDHPTDIEVSSGHWKIQKKNIVFKKSTVFGQETFLGRKIVTVEIGSYQDRIAILLYIFSAFISVIVGILIYNSILYS